MWTSNELEKKLTLTLRQRQWQLTVENKTEINMLEGCLVEGQHFLWLVFDTRAETGIESILAWWDQFYFTFNSSSTFSSCHLAAAPVVCTNTAPFPSCTAHFVYPPPLLCCRAVVWLRDAENKWQVTTDHGRKKAGHRSSFSPVNENVALSQMKGNKWFK